MAEQDQKLIKFITARQSKLETDKTAFMERMKEVAEYVAPHREDVYGNLQRGAKKGTKIFDGVGERSTKGEPMKCFIPTIWIWRQQC